MTIERNREREQLQQKEVEEGVEERQEHKTRRIDEGINKKRGGAGMDD